VRERTARPSVGSVPPGVMLGLAAGIAVEENLMWKKLALLAVLIAGVAGTAAVPAASAAPASAACSASYVTASLPWGNKCLRAGQFCKVGNRAYVRFGFVCPASGHLRRS
jgi:hypothetical protein